MHTPHEVERWPMLSCLPETHPLISFYRDFCESTRCKVFDAVESWLRNAKEAEKSRKLLDFSSWLSRRFQPLNKLNNLWPCLSELAIANHLSRRADSTRFDDTSLQKPPDFEVTLDGNRVLIETKLVMREFARDLEIDALLHEGNARLNQIGNHITLKDNWDRRCFLLANKGDVQELHREIKQFEERLRELDYSALGPGTVFGRKYLKVIAEGPTRDPQITDLLDRSPFGVEKLMGILQRDIDEKRKKKTIQQGQMYFIVLDVRTFSLFRHTDAWELRRLPEYSNIALKPPPDVTGVAVIQTDFGEPPVRVLETLPCNDGESILERLFPLSTKDGTC